MTYSVSAAHPVLPKGMTLSHLIELIERLARHLGLSGARRAVLLRMMRQTAPADWLDPGRDPVCFRAQQDLARELGITDRTLRLHERALELLGLIRIDTAANGRRSGRQLSNGRRLGINFRPMLESLATLLALDADHRQEAHRISVLRLECSAAKRDVKKAIERLLESKPRHPMLPDLLRRFGSWPRRYASFRSAKDLAQHLAEVETVLEKARDCLGCHAKTSAKAEAEHPAITNTIPKILETVVADDGMSPRTSGDGASRSALNARAEQRHDDLSWLSPETVRAIAGPDFRFCLEATCPTGIITERTLRSAAIILLRDLGIADVVWQEALEQLGSFRAALAVLIIDANRDHPVAPIRTPGAVLRTMVARDRAGGLDLSGALRALKRRKWVQG